MTSATNERGTALVATLGLAAILLPLGAFVVMQCRTDLLIQHNLRAELEAFYVAEAGLEHAVAEIAPGTSFDSILVGLDHVAGTVDDGEFPFAGGPPDPFPHAPFRYEVHVARIDSGAVRVSSHGTGVNAAEKVVSAVVARSPLAFTPAALYVDDGAAMLDLGHAGFLVSGFDHELTDPPDAPRGAAAAVPALGTARADDEATVRRRLSNANAQQLVGAGGAPSLAVSSPVDLPAYTAAIRNRPESVRVSAVAPGTVLGTPTVPQLSVAGGDLEVSDDLSGNGVLLVQGTLHVRETFAFTGVVIALGGIVFEPASRVTIAGAFWRGSSQDPRLELRGRGAIVYSSVVLAAIESAYPGLLPHAAVVTGWQEQL